MIVSMSDDNERVVSGESSLSLDVKLETLNGKLTYTVVFCHAF